jgi:hypothetical protein
VKAAGLSGHVYEDLDDDGFRDAGEAPIRGVRIELTGTDDRGDAVSLSTTTDAAGFYKFMTLRPGNYQLKEFQPSGYIDGKDRIGTQGGTTGNDLLTNITLLSGVLGTDNDFGELPTASVCGFVYHDVNNNGIKNTGEAGIGNVLITLTGIDMRGNEVVKTQRTDSRGAYCFMMLLPGNYDIIERQPGSPWIDGKDTPGTGQGRFIRNDNLFVTLTANDREVNYNFGERKPQQVTNPNPPTPNPNPPPPPPPPTGRGKGRLIRF